MVANWADKKAAPTAGRKVDQKVARTVALMVGTKVAEMEVNLGDLTAGR